MVSPQARREQVAFACERGLSERRACGLVGLPRSCLSYQLRLPVKDAPTLVSRPGLPSLPPNHGVVQPDVRQLLYLNTMARWMPSCSPI